MFWMFAYDPETGEYFNHKGDSGGMSMAFWLDDERQLQYEHDAKPRVGVAMRVGSISARSFTAQDWWQTTIVEEILEEFGSDGRLNVKFRTKNSFYHWKGEQ